jgi:hypothetical protein
MFSLMLLFCGGLGEPPMQAPEPPIRGSEVPVATQRPPNPPSPAPNLNADSEESRDAGATPSESTLADASHAGRSDAGDAGHGLGPEPIRRVVLAHRGALQACFELESRKDPGLGGSITVDWVIDANGSVSDARMAESTMHNQRVEGCVVNEVRSWRFPPSDGRSTVSYPFSFGAARHP